MLGSSAQTQMARAGQMPVIKTSSTWLTKIHPYYATYLKQIATAKPRTPTPKWTQIDTGDHDGRRKGVPGLGVRLSKL